jgi:prepilin-type N-terminal cleavage/methylation domain-containing protein
MTRKHRFGRNGFTIIELMSVVVIMGVLAAMAIPTFVGMVPRLNLKSDARTNLNYLRTARSRAVSENSQYGVFFDISRNRLILFKDTNNPANTIYTAGQDSVMDSSAVLHRGIAYNSVTFTGNSVVFLSSGSASSSGSLILRQSATSKTYTINVLASTGRVTLQ